MSEERTFTRAEILEAMALTPCHITGMHTPDHHLDHVCADMMRAAANGVLALIGATPEDLPHRLHDDCGWCHDVPSQEEYRARLRRTYEWAGVEIPADLAAPAPDAPCFDVPKREVLRAVKKLSGGESWVSIPAIRDELGLSMHTPLLGRPLHALEADGKIEGEFINNMRCYRPRRNS